MNFILLTLTAVLGVLISVLMTRRDELKSYRAESEDATYEVRSEKEVAFLAGTFGVAVAVIAFFAIDIGWFSILEVPAILIAGYVVLVRLRHQRAVLATCKDVRQRRRSAAAQKLL